LLGHHFIKPIHHSNVFEPLKCHLQCVHLIHSQSTPHIKLNFTSGDDPGVDSASNRNEYQEYFLGVKAAGAWGWNLPPSCAVVTKSGILNFLEASGPLRACNGTALPFFYIWWLILL